VDSCGDEHATLAVDDESPVVIAHVEWLEEVGRGHCKLNYQRQ
jgi:hypothetical protein